MALSKQQEKAIRWLKTRPVELGRCLGFTKLTELHNEWIRDMLQGEEDETLQAHRGSYKTTCVSIVLALIILLFPNDKTLFIRKTTNDIVEVIAQVKKILLSEYFQYLCRIIWNCDLVLTIDRADQLSTNLAAADPRGTPQLVAMGTQGSMTGKHFDRIFTDDIVNVSDRVSKAERERTKVVYQELQNIKNRNGRIYNTGTPWHVDDAFVLMPPAKKYSCYDTGLIDEHTIADIKAHMTASLFAANYELRHIASDDLIFQNPQVGFEPSMVEQSEAHIDAAYSGEDYTAFTIMRKVDDKYYAYGRIWRKHVDDCLDEVVADMNRFNCIRISCEDNADKGYLAKELKKRGFRVRTYHESMNKFIKITSYLKSAWLDVCFVAGTDPMYIEQVCDYNENADHDDAPDSLSSKIRDLWRKKEREASSIDSYFM